MSSGFLGGTVAAPQSRPGDWDVAIFIDADVLPAGLRQGERHYRHSPHTQDTFSSFYRIPLVLWGEVGGFDERFDGWGWEDLALACACHDLGLRCLETHDSDAMQAFITERAT